MSERSCTCVLCTAAPVGRDAPLVDTIEQHGWSALRIAGTIEFAYTVGLWHTYRMPEIVMFGLDGGHMQQLLNRCAEHVRANGWPQAQAQAPFTGVLEGFETRLRPVDESWRDALFGTAYRFYRGWPVPVWQLVWPDANGRWPWQDGATASSRTRQAFAWLPVDEHPAGAWQLQGHFGSDFPLAGEPDGWALTTRSILDGSRRPATVLLDDYAYDVLDERGHDADDLCVTYLGHLVLRLPELRALGDQADDAVAEPTADGGWRRSAISGQQREASAAAWKRAERYLPT